MNKRDLFFHETFQPEVKYIAEILKLASNSFVGTKYEISDITGIPTGKEKGKVEPHIRYAKYMGLIEYSCERGVYSLSATSLGETIFTQDCFLHETLSLWLLHYGISGIDGAPQWKFVVREINKGFNSSVSNSFFSTTVSKNFELNSAEIGKYFGVVKNSYLSGIFEKLKYLNWDDDISYNETGEQYELEYFYAYVLLDSWDKTCNDKNEITFVQIVEDLAYGKILGLNDEQIDSVLSSLEEMGIVKINRQLFPITVIKLESADNIIDKLYSLLL